jgi:hypothetical protein
MKKLFSLLLTFLCLHVYAQKNPFADKPLKGKVKSVGIKAQNLLPPGDTTKFVLGGEIDRVAFQYDNIPFRFEYDRNGNLTFLEDYDFFYKKKFNTKNQLTEIAKHSKGNPKKRLMEKTTCEYSEGLLIDSTIYAANFSETATISERNVFVYDKNKKLQELITKKYKWTNTGGVYESETKTAYKYNAQSRLLEVAKYDKSGKLRSTDRYLYDNKGRKIKELTETSRESDNHYSKYVYDQQNNVIESGIYDFGNKPQIKRVFKYSTNNLLIERTYAITNYKTLKTLFSYNSKKQLVKVQEFINDKEYYLNELTLDQKGNVVASMFYLPGRKPLIKHIHQIEYYD